MFILLKTLLRIFSFVFHFLLSLFLLVISGLALFSGTHNLKLEMLPWRGKSLTYWLFSSALFGLIAVVLAGAGKLRLLFLLWALAVFVMLVRGYFLSPYSFSGVAEFRNVLCLMAGALLAIIGAWLQLWRRRERR
jgi:Ni,Fe-hydrogenase I cytochrome b subunit